MKTIKLTIAALAAGALLLGCATNTDAVDLTQDQQDAYTLNAVSGVSILASSPLASPLEDNGAIIAPKLLETSSEDTTTEIPEEEVVTDFTQYITLMDTLLSDEGAPMTVVELTSDKAEYEFMLEITTRDLASNEMTYIMYFNQMLDEEDVDDDEDDEEDEQSEIEEISSEDDEEEDEESFETSVITTEPEARRRNEDIGNYDDDDEEDIEDHGNYDDAELHDDSENGEYDRNRDRDIGDSDDDDEVYLKGIVIYEGLEYELIGMREIEEDESEYKFFIALDENNWIHIKTETELDEEKYSIAMKKDGEFSKMSFKIEQDTDGETKVMFRTLIDGEFVSYMFKRMVNEQDQEIILIKVIENGGVLHIIAVPSIDEVTGETVYEFFVMESGRNYEGRPGHGNHDHQD